MIFSLIRCWVFVIYTWKMSLFVGSTYGGHADEQLHGDSIYRKHLQWRDMDVAVHDLNEGYLENREINEIHTMHRNFRDFHELLWMENKKGSPPPISRTSSWEKDYWNYQPLATHLINKPQLPVIQKPLQEEDWITRQKRKWQMEEDEPEVLPTDQTPLPNDQNLTPVNGQKQPSADDQTTSLVDEQEPPEESLGNRFKEQPSGLMRPSRGNLVAQDNTFLKEDKTPLTAKDQVPPPNIDLKPSLDEKKSPNINDHGQIPVDKQKTPRSNSNENPTGHDQQPPPADIEKLNIDKKNTPPADDQTPTSVDYSRTQPVNFQQPPPSYEEAPLFPSITILKQIDDNKTAKPQPNPFVSATLEKQDVPDKREDLFSRTRRKWMMDLEEDESSKPFINYQKTLPLKDHISLVVADPQPAYVEDQKVPPNHEQEPLPLDHKQTSHVDAKVLSKDYQKLLPVDDPEPPLIDLENLSVESNSRRTQKKPKSKKVSWGPTTYFDENPQPYIRLFEELNQNQPGARGEPQPINYQNPTPEDKKKPNNAGLTDAQSTPSETNEIIKYESGPSEFLPYPRRKPGTARSNDRQTQEHKIVPVSKLKPDRGDHLIRPDLPTGGFPPRPHHETFTQKVLPTSDRNKQKNKGSAFSNALRKFRNFFRSKKDQQNPPNEDFLGKRSAGRLTRIPDQLYDRSQSSSSVISRPSSKYGNKPVIPVFTGSPDRENNSNNPEKPLHPQSNQSKGGLSGFFRRFFSSKQKSEKKPQISGHKTPNRPQQTQNKDYKKSGGFFNRLGKRLKKVLNISPSSELRKPRTLGAGRNELPQRPHIEEKPYYQSINPPGLDKFNGKRAQHHSNPSIGANQVKQVVPDNREDWLRREKQKLIMNVDEEQSITNLAKDKYTQFFKDHSSPLDDKNSPIVAVQKHLHNHEQVQPPLVYQTRNPADVQKPQNIYKQTTPLLDTHKLKLVYSKNRPPGDSQNPSLKAILGQRPVELGKLHWDETTHPVKTNEIITKYESGPSAFLPNPSIKPETARFLDTNDRQTQEHEAVQKETEHETFTQKGLSSSNKNKLNNEDSLADVQKPQNTPKQTTPPVDKIKLVPVDDQTPIPMDSHNPHIKTISRHRPGESRKIHWGETTYGQDKQKQIKMADERYEPNSKGTKLALEEEKQPIPESSPSDYINNYSPSSNIVRMHPLRPKQPVGENQAIQDNTPVNVNKMTTNAEGRADLDPSKRNVESGENNEKTMSAHKVISQLEPHLSKQGSPLATRQAMQSRISVPAQGIIGSGDNEKLNGVPLTDAEFTPSEKNKIRKYESGPLGLLPHPHRKRGTDKLLDSNERKTQEHEAVSVSKLKPDRGHQLTRPDLPIGGFSGRPQHETSTEKGLTTLNKNKSKNKGLLFSNELKKIGNIFRSKKTISNPPNKVFPGKLSLRRLPRIRLQSQPSSRGISQTNNKNGNQSVRPGSTGLPATENTGSLNNKDAKNPSLLKKLYNIQQQHMPFARPIQFLPTLYDKNNNNPENSYLPDQSKVGQRKIFKRFSSKNNFEILPSAKGNEVGGLNKDKDPLSPPPERFVPQPQIYYSSPKPDRPNILLANPHLTDQNTANRQKEMQHENKKESGGLYHRLGEKVKKKLNISSYQKYRNARISIKGRKDSPKRPSIKTKQHFNTITFQDRNSVPADEQKRKPPDNKKQPSVNNERSLLANYLEPPTINLDTTSFQENKTPLAVNYQVPPPIVDQQSPLDDDQKSPSIDDRGPRTPLAIQNPTLIDYKNPPLDDQKQKPSINLILKKGGNNEIYQIESNPPIGGTKEQQVVPYDKEDWLDRKTQKRILGLDVDKSRKQLGNDQNTLPFKDRNSPFVEEQKPLPPDSTKQPSVDDQRSLIADYQETFVNLVGNRFRQRQIRPMRPSRGNKVTQDTTSVQEDSTPLTVKDQVPPPIVDRNPPIVDDNKSPLIDNRGKRHLVVQNPSFIDYQKQLPGDGQNQQFPLNSILKTEEDDKISQLQSNPPIGGTQEQQVLPDEREDWLDRNKRKWIKDLYVDGSNKQLANDQNTLTFQDPYSSPVEEQKPLPSDSKKQPYVDDQQSLLADYQEPPVNLVGNRFRQRPIRPMRPSRGNQVIQGTPSVQKDNTPLNVNDQVPPPTVDQKPLLDDDKKSPPIDACGQKYLVVQNLSFKDFQKQPPDGQTQQSPLKSIFETEDDKISQLQSNEPISGTQEKQKIPDELDDWFRRKRRKQIIDLNEEELQQSPLNSIFKTEEDDKIYQLQSNQPIGGTQEKQNIPDELDDSLRRKRQKRIIELNEEELNKLLSNDQNTIQFQEHNSPPEEDRKTLPADDKKLPSADDHSSPLLGNYQKPLVNSVGNRFIQRPIRPMRPSRESQVTQDNTYVKEDNTLLTANSQVPPPIVDRKPSFDVEKKSPPIDDRGSWTPLAKQNRSLLDYQKQLPADVHDQKLIMNVDEEQSISNLANDQYTQFFKDHSPPLDDKNSPTVAVQKHLHNHEQVQPPLVYQTRSPADVQKPQNIYKQTTPLIDTHKLKLLYSKSRPPGDSQNLSLKAILGHGPGELGKVHWDETTHPVKTNEIITKYESGPSAFLPNPSRKTETARFLDSNDRQTQEHEAVPVSKLKPDREHHLTRPYHPSGFPGSSHHVTINQKGLITSNKIKLRNKSSAFSNALKKFGNFFRPKKYQPNQFKENLLGKQSAGRLTRTPDRLYDRSQPISSGTSRPPNNFGKRPASPGFTGSLDRQSKGSTTNQIGGSNRGIPRSTPPERFALRPQRSYSSRPDPLNIKPANTQPTGQRTENRRLQTQNKSKKEGGRFFSRFGKILKKTLNISPSSKLRKQRGPTMLRPTDPRPDGARQISAANQRRPEGRLRRPEPRKKPRTYTYY